MYKILCVVENTFLKDETVPKHYLQIPKVGDFVETISGIELQVKKVIHCFDTSSKKPYIKLLLD